MNILRSNSRPAKQRAFTLIELLVVITIIAILAGLLLPVTQKVLESARKTTAKSTETNIIAAVNAYQTEYGQYPVVVAAGATPMDVTFGLSSGANSHNAALFIVLRAQNGNDNTYGTANPLLNSRAIVYFESKNVKNATNPRDGFIATGNPTGNPNASTVPQLAVGDLVDPWGNEYDVRIDSGYSNGVMNPYNTANPSTTDDDGTTGNDPTNQSTYNKVIHTGVIAWSWGNDGIQASKGYTLTPPYSPTPGDDVDSWQ